MSNSNDNKYIVDSGVKSPSEGGMNVKRRKSISIEHTPLDHEKKRPSIVTTIALDGTKKRKLKRTQSRDFEKNQTKLNNKRKQKRKLTTTLKIYTKVRFLKVV